MTIKFNNISNEAPYIKFRDLYDQAMLMEQDSIEVMAVSSYQKETQEVNSRYVNLKIIDDKKFIFFSNYNSTKANEFKVNNSVALIFYWNKTNVQIRMKAKINKTSLKFNQKYFSQRDKEKNALAISSNQSNKIESYSNVFEKYKLTLETKNLSVCPKHWGGYYLIPHYFEFWEGHPSRVNRREVFKLNKKNWQSYILEP